MILWFEISAQNLALKALFEIIVSLLASFYKAITSVWKLAWRLFICLNVKIFVTLRDYLVPLFFFEDELNSLLLLNS